MNVKKINFHFIYKDQDFNDFWFRYTQYETGAELINKCYFTNFIIYFITLIQHFRNNKTRLLLHLYQVCKIFHH